MHSTLLDRWNAISLRSKITGVTVLMLTVGLLVSGIGTMAMLKPYLVTQLDARLTAVAQGENLTSYFTRDDQSPQSAVAVRPGADYFIMVCNSEGEPLFHNWNDRPEASLPEVPTSLPLDVSSVTLRSGQIVQLHDAARRGEFRAITTLVTLDSHGTWGTAIIAVSLQQTNNLLTTYLTIFLCFGVGVIILGALLTRLLVTSAFGPLREVERTAAAIADGDFSQRLGGDTPNTEVGRLNRSLNRMLNRIDSAFRDRARTIEQMRRFVGDASHELRTPLVTVRGYAELYRMGALQTPDDVAQAMERIEKEALRMGGLVEDLLELARLDERRPLTFAPVDLVPLARDAALDAMASSPQRVVSVLTPPAIEAEDDDDPAPEEIVEPTNMTGPIAFAGATLARLRSRRGKRHDTDEHPVILPSTESEQPKAATPAIVMAAENKLRQVVANLMGNAMRFTAPDSPLQIRVQVDRPGQRAILDVIDHGEGIPPQIRERIFQRFWRADNSRARETGGSGLGLAIVASIVAAHNGGVEVLETEGGGATFRVTLPLANSALAPQPITGPPA